jgi:hypothetical protein
MIVKVPTEIIDLEAARGYAVAVARRVMALDHDRGEARRSWQIDITDEEGRVLLTVPFTDAITSGSA